MWACFCHPCPAALHSWSGQRRWASGGLCFSGPLLQTSFWGEIVVFCIFSPKCDRLKVTRAGPEITVTEYNPCTGRLKKEKQTAHCVCMEMGEELLGNHRISKCIWPNLEDNLYDENNNTNDSHLQVRMINLVILEPTCFSEQDGRHEGSVSSGACCF